MYASVKETPPYYTAQMHENPVFDGTGSRVRIRQRCPLEYERALAAAGGVGKEMISI